MKAREEYRNGWRVFSARPMGQWAAQALLAGMRYIMRAAMCSLLLTPGSLTAVIAAGMLVAVFSFNYCLLKKGGLYRPLTPTAL